MYGKSSSSSLVSIPNEVRTDLWLSSTSDAERSVRLYVGFKKTSKRPVLTPSPQCVFGEKNPIMC